MSFCLLNVFCCSFIALKGMSVMVQMTGGRSVSDSVMITSKVQKVFQG